MVDQSIGIYRRKGTESEVKAWQINPETVGDLAAWCNAVSVVEHDALDYAKTYPGLNVPTAAGNLRASEGDWVVKDHQGYFWVYKLGEFAQKFEFLV